MFSSVRIVKKAKPTVTLLGHFKGKSLDATSREFDGTGVVRDALKRGEATGAVGSITEAFDDNDHRFIIVGLGDAKTATVRTFHKAIGAAGRRLAKIKAGSVEIALGGAIAQTKLDDWRAGDRRSARAALVGPQHIQGKRHKRHEARKTLAPRRRQIARERHRARARAC